MFFTEERFIFCKGFLSFNYTLCTENLGLINDPLNHSFYWERASKPHGVAWLLIVVNINRCLMPKLLFCLWKCHWTLLSVRWYRHQGPNSVSAVNYCVIKSLGFHSYKQIAQWIETLLFYLYDRVQWSQNQIWFIFCDPDADALIAGAPGAPMDVKCHDANRDYVIVTWKPPNTINESPVIGYFVDKYVNIWLWFILFIANSMHWRI